MADRPENGRKMLTELEEDELRFLRALQARALLRLRAMPRIGKRTEHASLHRRDAGSKDVAAALAVSDLERARTFYEQTLGLELVQENPGAILYRSGSSTVLVWLGEPAMGAARAPIHRVAEG
jgi:Glyoxalase/Bleomycin resistance protein/Dioxygenase superfamily